MIYTLVIGLALALLLGIIAQRLKLSPLIGYLVAGMLAAQPWWGIEVSEHVVKEFSEVGVILLLFGVGLQFHFKDLLAVQKVAVPGACMCMALWTLLGALAYFWLGSGSTGWASALMFGMCVCVSSTVVLTRVLSDNKMLQTPAGHTALGWLVVEDIFTIILLVLLPVLFGNDRAGGSWGMVLGGMALKLALLVFCVAYLGRKVISRVLTYVSRSASGELFTLAVLVFALGIAVLSSLVFHASMEFGAFLSGMVVGQSKFASRAASDALPMRDAFAVLFFVSVGMGFHASLLLEHWELALGTVLLTLLVKPLTAYGVIRLLRRPVRLAVVVGTSLSQIGEFSFILAALAAGTYGMLPQYAANVIVGAAIITITLNAALYRYVPCLIDALEKRGIGVASSSSIPEPDEARHRVIVVGYGPCGELIARILHEYRVEVVVLEMNIDTVSRLLREGVPALHGDARLRTILQLAGAEKAQAIIITPADAPTREIAAAARSINPRMAVMAHTTYLKNARAMRQEGAESVVSGEEEAALTLSSLLLQRLGATDEQVVKERIKNRRLLSGERADPLED